MNKHLNQFSTRGGLLAMSNLLLVIILAAGCAASKETKVSSRAMPDLAMPSPGKAKVVFFRPDSNGGIDVGVHDGEQLVAKLPGKSYTVYESAPGRHLFSGSFGNLDILNANLSPDRIYYVQARMVVQMFGPAHIKLSPMTPDTADWQKMVQVLPKLKKRGVTPQEAEHDRKGIVQYMERLKSYQDKPGAVFESILPEYGQSTSLYSQ
jgi:hypothetical protein